MTTENVKALLDACYQAKRIRELLPALPEGVSPSFIQYLDVIEHLAHQGVRAKVSDISDALNIPRPGVTRTVKDMTDGGYLQKTASDVDGRVAYLSITEKGKTLSQTYNALFFSQLTPMLDDISNEDALCAVRTIQKLYNVMAERSIRLEYR